ncbi:MAG: hypothetical protein N3G19_03380 [Candidatus Pacearchaeota archaeon]|nr:hypothetical protein [Candidatus Pacearchaeota archaeon]
MAGADKIIAVVQPKYSENPIDIQKLIKEAEKKGVEKNKEVKEAKIREAIDKAKPKPVWDHAITYDSSSEQLEPIYFWILDFMSDLKLKVEKIVDNFTASAGGGYFAEIGTRATKMQEEGMKILGAVNTVIKSIINIIYDLKEFEIRLKQYDLAKSKDPKEAEAGLLGLKQIWLDKVDAQKGYGSINMMTRSPEIGFITLRDAFIIAKTPEDVDKMDLNDRVKRVLKPRVAEFLEWKARSEIELRKRYEIEKSYLKSQVGALKLYTRWAKPYLKAAEQLMMKEKKMTEPSLVSAFNTLLLELCILGTSEINIAESVDAKLLPPFFKELKLKRPYYVCILIDFSFRGIPQRVSQAGHYAFGGRVDINFKAFALNEDELKVFRKQLEKEDFYDALKLVEATTEESLAQLIEDINYFLEESKEEKTKKKKEKEKEKEPELGKIKKDSFEESVIRAFAEQQAAATCFKIYDVYKKSHGMASFAEPEWEIPRWRERK